MNNIIESVSSMRYDTGVLNMRTEIAKIFLREFKKGKIIKLGDLLGILNEAREKAIEAK